MLKLVLVLVLILGESTMVYETVPASEIKRRGIGMLDESLKRGPVFIISHNKPKYAVIDADEYRRMRHEEFVHETLESVEEYRKGLGRKVTHDELMAEILEAASKPNAE